ncbi:MAG: hypothetical protein NTX07_01720 [Solirubrobacterales bacterium]|nr:hypothetical protein [Solirubrobacterales bacterium]
MSFELRWTPSAHDAHDRLRASATKAAATRLKAGRTKSSKQEGLYNQVVKTIALLQDNPRHPSLNTHKYSSLPHPFSPNGAVFEAYAQNRTAGAYRVFWCYGPNKKCITILAITPHP